MDGAVDAAASGQRRVRRVDDCVGSNRRDVAQLEPDQGGRSARSIHPELC
jgi:hypothetical protein